MEERNAGPNSPLQAKLGICAAWFAIPALASRRPSVSGTAAQQRISQVEIAAGELIKQPSSRPVDPRGCVTDTSQGIAG